MADYRILVIEGNPKIGGLIAGQLREKGFDALDVRHGAEAAVALRQQLCNLILMDSQIPLGGVRTARILRLHPKYNTIPIILGLPPDKAAARQLIVQGQQVGLGNFLLKPFTLATLQKKMEEVLNSSVAAVKPTDLEIREEIRGLSQLPSMPATHARLLLLLNKADEEVDMPQVSKILEQDPGLSARVMRTCKSAYFGFQGQLMKQAVAFLGVSVIRKIVQSTVIYQFFGDEKEAGGKSMSMTGLWRHSLAAGLAMEIIGKADRKKTHFLLGVMHDIGKAVFKFRFPQHYDKVLELVAKENTSILEAERELLGITHADCGGELAVRWDLPAEVRAAITSHHDPEQSVQHRRLAAMVHIADIAVRTMKIGNPGDPLIPKMDPYASRLQKSVEEILTHRDDFVRQVDTIIGGQDEDAEEADAKKEEPKKEGKS
jgi:HD-like signal output (HDOD) protein